MRLPLRIGSSALVILATLLFFCSRGEAHKPITSKFTYNAEVFPLFLNRCSHCHVAGGVGPMSLVTYAEAFPWAESLRTELLDACDAAEGPANSDESDFIKAAHRDLSAHDLDIVLDWAVGGTPEGDAPKPPVVTLKNDWAGRKPDLALQPAEPLQVPANLMEITQELVLPTKLERARQISAIDLLPGTPAVVRDTTISVRAPNTPSQTLGRWIPRQAPAAVALKPGTTLSAGADIIVAIHYKKTWKYEGQTITDRSAVGIYFADN